MANTLSAVKTLAAAGLLMVFSSLTPVLAEENAHQHDHPPADQATGGQAPAAESSKAFESAMQKMHKDMAIPYTGDVDVDFVRGMIPHHQGAIEQAQVLLKYSKNPRLRRLAGGIIAAQRREIRFMQKWLKEHDQGTESSEMPDWLKNAPALGPDDAAADGADKP